MVVLNSIIFNTVVLNSYSIKFQKSNLEQLTKSLKGQEYFRQKQEFPNHWMLLSRKLAYSYDYYEKLEVYESLSKNY